MPHASALIPLIDIPLESPIPKAKYNPKLAELRFPFSASPWAIVIFELL
jgi:hypothetical protein